MAQDLEQLVLSISADTRQIQRALKKLEADTNASTGKVEKRFDTLGKKVNSSFDRIGLAAKRMLAGFVAGFTLREAQGLIDSATRIDNALKVAGLSGEQLTEVYDRLFVSAQKNAAPIESLVELYGRAALSAKELGATQEELLQFTDRIAVALRVGGKSAEESSGALLQLSQLLGSGTVRAEEFNSVQEGALPILQAVAAGLKEAGGSVSELRKLVIDGKVSSEAFFRAFEAGSVILEDKVADAVLTNEQAWTKLNNVLVDTAKKLNETTGAGEKSVGAINRLSDAVVVLGDFMARVADGPLGRFVGKLDELDQKAKSLFEFLGRFSLLDEMGAALGDYLAPTPAAGPDFTRVAGGKQGRPDSPIDKRINAAFGASLVPRSLDEFDAPSKKKTKTAKERADEYERLSRRIAETTAEMVAETEAQRQLNPLVDDYGFAADKARMARELLTAAEKAGKAITPELRAEIEALASEYARAGVEAAQLADSQDAVRDAMEDTRELGKDLLGGFVSDLKAGKSAADALAGALGKIGDKLLDMAANSLFGSSGSSGLGIIGSLLGGAFSPTSGGFAAMLGIPGYASGTSNHPGGLAVVGEKGPELLNLPKGSQVIPNMPAVASRPAGGGGVNFQPVYQIDARGADAAAVARLERGLAKTNAEMKATVVQTVRAANKQNVKFS